MRQLLNLLIVDCHRRSALVTHYGSRWLLPTLSCRERARVDPLLTRWLSDRSVPGHVAGHWLGRVTPAQDSMDWLVAISASPGACAANPALTWTPLDALSPGTALLNYQQWAVATALHRNALPSVRGPFGNFTWLDDVRAWIGTVVGEPDLGPITPFRATSFEVVLGVETGHGHVYFKGLADDRAVEARLTRALSEVVPRTFARTLAADKRPDGCVWWLAADCPGRALAECSDARIAGKVARTLARVQRRVMSSAPVLREMQEVDLPAATAWGAALMSDNVRRDAIRRACDEVKRADVPQSWIPLDLDPGNVLVDDDGRVSFIDLDDSFAGPAPLAMAMFARRSRDRSGYEPYEEAWFPFLRSIDWPGFELAAGVLETWLGWKRVEINTERGEIYGAHHLVMGRLAERLASAIYRQ
jgi:hypothetical protein